MRTRIKHRKHIRFLKKAHILKAWKDSRSYFKFIMSANLLTARMQQVNKQFLLHSMFNAVRLSKQTNKCSLMTAKHQQLKDSIVSL